MLPFKKWFRERERIKEIRRIRKEKFKSTKRKAKECSIEELKEYISLIPQNGFSDKEIKKLFLSLLFSRKDLTKDILEKMVEISKEKDFRCLIHEIWAYSYQNGIKIDI